MSSLARGNVKMALASVRAAKWRSTLTMFGIIVGIVSVVMVVGIGEGVKQQLSDQMTQFGADLITVRPEQIDASNSELASNVDLLFGLSSISGLTSKDLSAVSSSRDVRLVAPLGVVSGSVTVGNKVLTNGLVLATTGALPGVLNRQVTYGSFFGNPGDEARNVAVIGPNVAQTLFQEQAPLGQQFTFRGQQFIVGGVFGQFTAAPLSPATDFNDAIFIPYNTAERLTSNSTQLYSILVKPQNKNETQAAIHAINGKLLALHGGEQDFSVLDQQQNIAASSTILTLVTDMVATIAAISLFVGGVGVMNIMLASVTERTHEIGIRKAVGATNRQIMNQFLLESSVLSLVGGLIGVAVSLACVGLLRLYTSMQPVISWEAIVGATGASLIIGIIFGVTPAVKAAHKDPIDALRHE